MAVDSPKSANLEIHGILAEDFKQRVAEALEMLQKLQDTATVTIGASGGGGGGDGSGGIRPEDFPQLGKGGRGMPRLPNPPSGGTPKAPTPSGWIDTAESLAPVLPALRGILGLVTRGRRGGGGQPGGSTTGATTGATMPAGAAQVDQAAQTRELRRAVKQGFSEALREGPKSHTDRFGADAARDGLGWGYGSGGR